MTVLLSLLAFGCALLPGLAAWYIWREPCGEGSVPTNVPGVPLPEVAVLRDGAVGATRWAFAALVLTLAREGHCTLVRTRKRRWFRTGLVWTVNLHADPTALSQFEQTVLRQLGRHDTLDGFSFAGSTFRRRTLRDVRADLIERGWLLDRRRRSNALLSLGLVLVGVGLVAGLGAASAMSVGLGAGSLLAATRRYPATAVGAKHRARHRAFAECQRDQVRTHLSDAPERAADRLLDTLPHLVLERIATPRALYAVADRLDDVDGGPVPNWMQEEGQAVSSVAAGYRMLGDVLRALGARPLSEIIR